MCSVRLVCLLLPVILAGQAITLEEPAAIQGRVIDAATEKPIPGAAIVYTPLSSRATVRGGTEGHRAILDQNVVVGEGAGDRDDGLRRIRAGFDDVPHHAVNVRHIGCRDVFVGSGASEA